MAEGGDFLATPDEAAIPPLVELPRLLAAARGFLDDPDSAEDLWILLAPGSSLGGARPKASIRGTGGRLAIAKFPRDNDTYSVGAWEHLALELARDVTAHWAERARAIGIAGSEIDLMASAFEHEDLDLALGS